VETIPSGLNDSILRAGQIALTPQLSLQNATFRTAAKLTQAK